MRMNRAVVIRLMVAFCCATCFAQVRTIQPRGTTTPASAAAPVQRVNQRAEMAKLSAAVVVKSTGQIQNPAAMMSPVLSTLQQQKQAADVESGQIMSAAPGQTSSGARVAPANKPAGMLAAKPGMAAAPPANKPPMGAVVNPAAANICLANTVGIRSVNQKSSGIIFTPDPRYNLYTITGCGFGTTPGKIYLQGGAGAFPAHSGKIMLAPVDPVRGWTDRAIIAKVDPNVTGELDQKNISLVVESASGQRGQINGFSFYALRGPAFPLKQIAKSAACFPLTEASLCQDGGTSLEIRGGLLTSPGSGGATAELYRDGPWANAEGSGANQSYTDRFTPKLKPGFAVSSAMLKLRTMNGSVLNPYSVKFTGNAVDILETATHKPPPWGSYEFFVWYDLTLWVYGPAGITDPLADGQ